MVIKYNKEVDVIYIQFSEAEISESFEENPGVVLDYDKDGNIAGIEILNASKTTNYPNGIIYEVAS